MKAIILAAGQGTRLRPMTDDRPKAMVEANGRPLLAWQLDVLGRAGIKDIVVVTGYCEEAINIPGLRKCHNPRFQETNMVASLFCAEDELQDDVLIVYGDIVFESPILDAILACKAPLATTIDKDWEDLWRLRMEDPLLDAETLKIDSEGFILELGRKPKSVDEIEGQYMGLIKLTNEGCQTVRRHYNALDRTARYEDRSFDQMFMTSFLQSLIDNGHPLRAVEVAGGWLEFDAPPDLALFKDRLPSLS
jgi:L-glutamine-phosphate cytidylyltransferase